MSTVIDELIVVLGLDTSKFTEGQRDALAAFKKTKEGADSFGKDIEARGAKLSDLFATVKRGLVGVVAGIAGGQFMQVVGHINEMDAATGRWAKTIGTSVPNLSTWQGMIRQVGGSAQEATATLATLQQEIESVRQGGGMFDGGFASLMNQSGASIRDDADTVLRKVQKFISEQVNSGKMRPEEATTYLRRVPGMNQNMVNLLLSDLGKVEAAAKAAGTATKESADEAIKYQESLNQLSLSAEGLGRVLTIKVTPALVSFLDRTKQIIQEFSAGVFISPDSWLGKKLGRDKAAAKPDQPAPSTGATASTSTSSSTSPSAATTSSNKALLTAAASKAWVPPSADLSASSAAIAAIESRGSGGYAAVGPITRTGDRAYGKYQVMGRNVPEWTKQALGQSITPEEFLKSPEAQEAVFNKRFGDLQKKYGPAGAAAAWFAGEGGMKDPERRDAVGTSVSGYVSKYMQNLGAPEAARGRAAGENRSSSSTSNEVHIGKIEVNAPNATDASGIAGEIGDAMKRQSLIAPANYGLV